MKKIFTLICGALLTVSAIAVENEQGAATLPVLTLEQVQNAQPQFPMVAQPIAKTKKMPKKAALSTAANVAPAYKVTANVLMSEESEEIRKEEWIATTGIDPVYNTPYINGVLPKGIFYVTQPFDYEIKDNQMVIPATFLGLASSQYPIGVYAMDITDFKAKGSGSIVLDLAEDGTLSIPAANVKHDYGYAFCMFDAQDITYTPTQLLSVACTVTAMVYRPLQEPATKVSLNASEATVELDQLADSKFTVDAKATKADIHLSIKAGAVVGQFEEKQIDGTESYITYDGVKYTLDPERSAITSTLVSNAYLDYEGTVVGVSEAKEEIQFSLSITSLFTDEWSAWEAYAPFGKSTGKWTYSAAVSQKVTVPNLATEKRVAKSGLQEYKISNFGKYIFGETGVDLVIQVDGLNNCAIQKTEVTKLKLSTGGTTPLYIVDMDTYLGQITGKNKWNPESGEFDLCVNYYYEQSSKSYTYGNGDETFVMDKEYTRRDTVIVESNLMSFNNLIESNQLALFYFNTDEYQIFRVGATTNGDYLGTFTWKDNGISYLNSYYVMATDSTSKKLYFQDGEFTVSLNEAKDTLVLTGVMIGVDEKAYKLNLKGLVGTLPNDQKVPFEGKFAWANMFCSIGDSTATIQALNTENQAVRLLLYIPKGSTQVPAGEYPFTDTKAAGTALASVGMVGQSIKYSLAGEVNAAGSFIKMWFITGGSVTVGYDEDGKMNLQLNGTNSWKLPVTATFKYEKLNPKATVTFDSEDLFVDAESLIQNGYIIYSAANQTMSITMIGQSETIEGSFDNSSIMFMASSLVVNKKSLNIIDGSFTVTKDGKNITLKGTVMGSDTVNYELNLTGIEGALEHDTKSEGFEATFAPGEWQASAQQGVIMILGVNAKYQSCMIYMFATPVDGKIPAGEYTIDGTYYEKTVLASQGIVSTTSGQQIMPSFAGILQGQSYSDVWFMVGGTVTVDENSNITVDAINSYDQKINIKIQASASALEGLKAAPKAMKVMRDNRIEINVNNKRFNILGNVIR